MPKLIAAEALLGLAFNQVINSFRSLAGIVFLATRTYGVVAKGEIGAKSFSTSYGSEYKALFSAWVDMPPIPIVYPSDRARATRLVPIFPSAPLTFSMIMGRPSDFLIRSAKARPITSGRLP